MTAPNFGRPLGRILVQWERVGYDSFAELAADEFFRVRDGWRAEQVRTRIGQGTVAVLEVQWCRFPAESQGDALQVPLEP
jgi:hypothetical protein